jgi:hypothetical protein
MSYNSDKLGSVKKNGITLTVYTETTLSLDDLTDLVDVYFWNKEFYINNDKSDIEASIREAQEHGGVLVPAKYAYQGSGYERVYALKDYAITFPIAFEDPKMQKMINEGYLEDTYMPPVKTDYADNDEYADALNEYLSDWDYTAVQIIINYLNEGKMNTARYDYGCDGFAIGTNLQDAIDKIEGIDSILKDPPVDFTIDYDSPNSTSINGVVNSMDEIKETINSEAKEEDIPTMMELVDNFEYEKDKVLDDTAGNIKPSDMDKFM